MLFVPGGSTDILAHLIAERDKWSRLIHEKSIVVN
jgi:hypothetical protein